MNEKSTSVVICALAVNSAVIHPATTSTAPRLCLLLYTLYRRCNFSFAKTPKSNMGGREIIQLKPKIPTTDRAYWNAVGIIFRCLNYTLFSPSLETSQLQTDGKTERLQIFSVTLLLARRYKYSLATKREGGSLLSKTTFMMSRCTLALTCNGRSFNSPTSHGRA